MSSGESFVSLPVLHDVIFDRHGGEVHHPPQLVLDVVHLHAVRRAVDSRKAQRADLAGVEHGADLRDGHIDMGLFEAQLKHMADDAHSCAKPSGSMSGRQLPTISTDSPTS